MPVEEAIIICLDVGSNKDFLDLAKKCIEEILQRKIFSLNKDQIALILFNGQTSNTDYNCMELVREFDVPDVNFLKQVMDVKSERTATLNGYFIDAIRLSHDIFLSAFPKPNDQIDLDDDVESGDNKKRKGTSKIEKERLKNANVERRILLFTDLEGECEQSVLESLPLIVQQFHASEIKMDLIGIDLEQHEDGNETELFSKLDLDFESPYKKHKSPKKEFTPSPRKSKKSPNKLCLKSPKKEFRTPNKSNSPDHKFNKLTSLERNIAIFNLIVQEVNKLQNNCDTPSLIQSFTFDQVFDSIASNQLAALKQTKSMPQYNTLMFGRELLNIPLKGLYRIKRATFPRNWKTLDDKSYGRPGKKAEESENDEFDSLDGFIVPDENDIKKMKKKQEKRKDTTLKSKPTVILQDEIVTGSSDDEQYEYTDLKFKPDYVKAYKYGNTLVPFSKEDELAAQNLEPTNQETEGSREKGLIIIGFTKSENIHSNKFLGDGCIEFFWDDKTLKKKKKSTTAKRKKSDEEMDDVDDENDDALSLARAFEALVYGMYELDMVGIARYISTTRGAQANQPKIVCLRPRVKFNYRCLILNVLPFLEDIRFYRFPNLYRSGRNTYFGKDTTAHEIPRQLETPEQLQAIDDLIDAMDLMPEVSQLEDVKHDLATEISAEQNEKLKPKYTANPYFNRLINALSQRAISYLKTTSHHQKKNGIDLDDIVLREDIKPVFSANDHVLKKALHNIDNQFTLNAVVPPPKKIRKKYPKHESIESE